MSVHFASDLLPLLFKHFLDFGPSLLLDFLSRHIEDAFQMRGYSNWLPFNRLALVHCSSVADSVARSRGRFLGIQKATILFRPLSLDLLRFGFDCLLSKG